MIDSVDECTDTRKHASCAPYTFEQGKDLVERDGMKPAKDGWIKLLAAPWMTLARRLSDPEDNCRVVETANGDIAKSWDYCMGVLSGMGYNSVWSHIVFVDGCKPYFKTEINVAKNDMGGFRLDVKDNRWYALESYKSYSEQAAVLTRMWKALEEDIPPRLRDNVIRTLAGFSSLEGDPDGVFTMTDYDRNVFHFEIHRGALLRLDDNDKVIGAGLGALYPLNPVTWCC